jgi:rfaE bifunctional protein nucleotidyltransferase chain/domain
VAKCEAPREPKSKIVRWSELAGARADAKAAGKKVVFTNGCFDLLHIGHIRYLYEARRLGDLLIVGINSDDSVRRLKGPERPFVSAFERLEVIAALESVDYVALFNEDTPVELIEIVRPDIHVKGGDYRPEELPEAEAVRKHGGEVVVVRFHQTHSSGRSTTGLVGKIRE